MCTAKGLAHSGEDGLVATCVGRGQAWSCGTLHDEGFFDCTDQFGCAMVQSHQVFLPCSPAGEWHVVVQGEQNPLLCHDC